MNIVFDVEAIVKTSMENIVPRLFVTGPRDHRERDRIYEKHEKQYAMLTWLGWQFNGIHILDVGARAGTSAFCLADNPANKVTACDITPIYKNIDIRPFLWKGGIDFIQGTADAIPVDLIRQAPILSLDISHNGVDEFRFLTRLDRIGYNGIVIMDDVNFPRRFIALNEVWNGITKQKLLLPRVIAHDTGTGIVVYGQHTVSVAMPTDESKG